jgi:TonB family protein
MWGQHGSAEDGGFKVTFTVIAAVHVLAVGVLLSLSLHPPKRVENDLVWVDPGAFNGDAPKGSQNPADPVSAEPAPSVVDTTDEPAPAETAPPTPVPENAVPPPTAPPPPVSSPSDLSLTPMKPSPAPATTTTPRPIATLTPKPTRKVKPGATPKPTPIPSPTLKPSPSASPKSSPKGRPSPETSPKPLSSSKSMPTSKAFPSAKPSASPSAEPGKKAPRAEPANGRGPDSLTDAGDRNAKEGGSGQGQGGGSSDLSGYAQTIKMRFDSAWDQPRGQIPPGSHLVATVRLKIQPDGTVSEFTVVQGSGNPVVDETIREAGRKITRLPPPPGGGVFSPVVRFELGD